MISSHLATKARLSDSPITSTLFAARSASRLKKSMSMSNVLSSNYVLTGHCQLVSF
jgi:hypothetical protein